MAFDFSSYDFFTTFKIQFQFKDSSITLYYNRVKIDGKSLIRNSHPSTVCYTENKIVAFEKPKTARIILSH